MNKQQLMVSWNGKKGITLVTKVLMIAFGLFLIIRFFIISTGGIKDISVESESDRGMSEVSQYSKPSEFEFTVYKHIVGELLKLGSVVSGFVDKTMQRDSLIKKVAEEFNLTFEDAKKIYVKFRWYESQIRQNNFYYKYGDIIKMKWVEVKDWIDIIGPPEKPNEKF